MASIFYKNSLFYFSIIFTSLMILDVISTKMALSQGFQEQNPIMQGIVKNTIIFILLKLSISGVIIFMMKNCIKRDRKTAINGMRILTAFMLLVVLGNGLTIMGAAESGTIAISDEQTRSYSMVSSAGAVTGNLSHIYLDIGNYTTISNFAVNLSFATFSKEYESANFNIVTGGVGTGIVYYYKDTKKVYYVFSSNPTITTSRINISVGNSLIFSNITAINGNDMSASSVNYTNPICIGRVGSITSCIGTAGGLVYNDVHVITQAQDTYNVTYPIDGYFTVNVTKNQVLSSMYYINSYIGNTTYSSESTYNKVNFTGATHEYGAGISLKTTLASGLEVTTYVNSTSGGTLEQARAYPATGANIYTDKSSYVIGDNINVEWFIADDPYDDLGVRCRFLVNDEATVSDIPQHDNYTIIAPAIGSYKLTVACGVLWYDTVAETTVNVIAEGQSYLLFNNSQFTRIPFNITYHIGYSLAGYSSTWIDIGIFASTGQKIDALTGITTNDGQLQAQASRVYPEGVYTVKLYDAKRNAIIFNTPLTIVKADSIPVIGISVSNITTDRDYYYINDFMNINYRVDDSNYTNYSIMVQIYNNNISQITKQYTVTTTEQVGSFDTFVNTKDNLLCEGARYCWFESGINSVRLVAYNSTFSKILDTKNITVSATTVDGWGLILSSNNITTTEKLTIRTIIPTGSTGTLRIRDAGYGNTTSIYSQNVNEGTNTYITSVNRVNRDGVGYYDVELKDSFGNVKIHIPLTVRKIIIDTTITTPTTPQTMNNLMTFISLPAFWGILLFIVCVIGTAWKASDAVGIVALILSNLEAIVGLWSPYTIYVFIVTWIIAAIFFTIGRKTTTGGS